MRVAARRTCSLGAGCPSEGGRVAARQMGKRLSVEYRSLLPWEAVGCWSSDWELGGQLPAAVVGAHGRSHLSCVLAEGVCISAPMMWELERQRLLAGQLGRMGMPGELCLLLMLQGLRLVPVMVLYMEKRRSVGRTLLPWPG